MTNSDSLLRAWADQAIRPVIREILRDELADIIPTLNQASSNTVDENPLNVGQAAEYLGISKQTIYQNITKLPHRKKHGRIYFFKAELTDYLNEKKAS